MNAKDGSPSNLESSSEDNKNKEKNTENEDENPGEEVVTKTDATNCDIKPLEGLKYFNNYVIIQTRVDCMLQSYVHKFFFSRGTGLSEK